MYKIHLSNFPSCLQQNFAANLKKKSYMLEK